MSTTNADIEKCINDAFSNFKEKTSMCRTPACRHEAEHLREEIKKILTEQKESYDSPRD